jgi:hypothetical protein
MATAFAGGAAALLLGLIPKEWLTGFLSRVRPHRQIAILIH